MKLEVSASSMCSLAFSVAVSCFSLGLGLATRDKTTSMILGLPGKLQWSFHMALLVFVRSMEVASRILAINILHVSIRTQHISLGGPATFAALLLVSRVLLPEAEAVDLMAAIIGHPGQILEPTSVLPLRNSLCLHGGLVLAALMAQVWVQRGSQTVFEAAKARDSRGGLHALFPSFAPFPGRPMLGYRLVAWSQLPGHHGPHTVGKAEGSDLRPGRTCPTCNPSFANIEVEHPMFQRLHKKRGEDGSLDPWISMSFFLGRHHSALFG